ncbi:MAG: DUF5615 family PIN-like protein [bacterium]
MNLPRELAKRLKAKGYECRHIGDIGMAQASDIAIIEEAKENKEVIATHDLDYSHLLAFSGEREPSVIIFRLHYTHPYHLFARLMDAWFEIEVPLREGAIVVLEDTTLRIRRLPITREEE